MANNGSRHFRTRQDPQIEKGGLGKMGVVCVRFFIRRLNANFRMMMMNLLKFQLVLGSIPSKT
jgi:hypothetical protein